MFSLSYNENIIILHIIRRREAVFFVDTHSAPQIADKMWCHAAAVPVWYITHTLVTESIKMVKKRMSTFARERQTVSAVVWWTWNLCSRWLWEHGSVDQVIASLCEALYSCIPWPTHLIFQMQENMFVWYRPQQMSHHRDFNRFRQWKWKLYCKNVFLLMVIHTGIVVSESWQLNSL